MANNLNKKKFITKIAPVLSGFHLHRLFAPFYSGLGQILTFHRVIPEQPNLRIHNHESLEITPEQLEQTILYYRKIGYTFFSLDEMHHALTEKKPNKKFVVFTFDDGYRDNYTVAYPILKKHNVPFCIYVTTNFPDRKAILWWYLLEDLLRKNKRVKFHLGGKDYSFDANTLMEKENAFDEIRTLINQSFTILNFKETLQSIFDKAQSELFSYTDQLALRWEEIKTLSQDPLVTIATHTVNHFPLKQLNGTDIIPEILNSKKILESILQQPVEHFAYPFGKAPEASYREFEVVKSLGFKTATTTRMGNIFPQHKNHLECLPRISLNRVSTASVLSLQTSGMLPCLYHKGKQLVTH